MKIYGIVMKNEDGIKHWVRTLASGNRIMQFDSRDDAEIFRQNMGFPNTYEIEVITETDS